MAGKNISPCLLNGESIAQYQAAVAEAPEEQQVALLRQLLLNADAMSVVIEQALEEARAVLNGQVNAGDRLWLLLRNVEIQRNISALPDHLLRQSYGDKKSDLPDAPFLLNKDGLQDLIGGVVWAARNAEEEGAMLAALRQLLDPLLRLEYAWNALQQLRKGNPAVFETMVFEHRHSPTFDKGRPMPDPPTGIWKDRVDATISGVYRNPNPYSSEWTDIWGCMGRGRKVMSVYDRFAAPYHIDFISNPGACGGKEILIAGTNFGPMGRVFFPLPGPDDPVFKAHQSEIKLEGVEPISWDDNAITVRVPVWAVSGMIRLNAFHRVSDPCWVKDIFHPGNEFEFSGGLARVYQIAVNGVSEGTGINGELVIPPYTLFFLRYRATSRQDVNVRVEIVDEDGNTLLLRDGLPGGVHSVGMTLQKDPGQPVRGEMILTATSDCGSTGPLRVPVVIAVAPELVIDYVEVTQGVQLSKEEVAKGDAVPLAANKDTAVRVYLRCNRNGWFEDRLDKISGALRITTPGGLFTLAPTNTRPVRPDRGQIEVINHSYETDEHTTLNFLIPAGWCTPGSHVLTVTIRCPDMSGLIQLTRNINWTWFEKRPIRTRWLVINEEPSDSFTLLPGLDQFLRDTLLYFPSPVWDVGPAWITNWSQPEDFTTVGAWPAILEDLEEFKHCTTWNDLWPFDDHCENTDDDARWIAIVRPGAPTSDDVPSGITTEGGTVSVARLIPETAAHELGHQLGLEHVNLAGKDQSIDAPYDDVGNGGYLTRPAFNVRDQKVIMGDANRTDNFYQHNPMTADLMSYLRPRFLSAFHWRKVFDLL